MDLTSFFHLTASIFCIVATIFMITLFVFGITLWIQLEKLIKKLQEISEIAKSTAGDTKEFIDRTIKSLEAFKNSIFTFEFVRKIVTEIIDHLKNNKKGVKNGQTE